MTNALTKYDIEIKVSTALKRTKRTRQQARLSKTERRKNMKDAFVWTGLKPAPQEVVLVDDVVASGETLESAARTLKSAGSHKVYAVVFARGGQ